MIYPSVELPFGAFATEHRQTQALPYRRQEHLTETELHKTGVNHPRSAHESAAPLSASRKLFLIRYAKVSGIEITTLSMKMMLVFNPSARFPAWELTASLQESQVKPEGAARLSTASMNTPLSKTPLQLCVEFNMPRFYARLGLSG